MWKKKIKKLSLQIQFLQLSPNYKAISTRLNRHTKTVWNFLFYLYKYKHSFI